MSTLGLCHIPEHPESLDPNETQNETRGDLMLEFRIPTISIKVHLTTITNTFTRITTDS